LQIRHIGELAATFIGMGALGGRKVTRKMVSSAAEEGVNIFVLDSQVITKMQDSVEFILIILFAFC
jgi:hypothetical protein